MRKWIKFAATSATMLLQSIMLFGQELRLSHRPSKEKKGTQHQHHLFLSALTV